jgi:hypothetical protein
MEQYRAALEWEEIQPDFKHRYPKAAQALSEYRDTERWNKRKKWTNLKARRPGLN